MPRTEVLLLPSKDSKTEYKCANVL